MERIANSTIVYFDLHPCFEVVNSTYDFARTPSVQCVFIYISLIIFSLITVSGNVLVIISVCYFKQLQTPTNLLLLSLAMTDVLAGLVILPLNTALTVSFCHYREHISCEIRAGIASVLCTSSIMHLGCIAIDRYCAVCKPLKYTVIMTHRAVGCMSLVCWGISVISAIAIMVVGFNHGKCEGDCSADILISNILSIVFAFYLPTFIMVIIYLRIYIVAQKQARSIQSTNTGSSESKKERKAKKTLAIILGVFLTGVTPYFLCFQFTLVGYVMPTFSVIEAVVWIAWSNSMINPFIYAYFYTWFRSAFKMIVTGKIFQGDYTNTKLF